MDRLRASRIAAFAALLPVLALTGCQSGSTESTESGDATQSSSTPIPKPDPDEYEPITVHLTAPAWSAPPGTEGELLGCDDLLVSVETVPSGAEDPADMALDFLLEDATGEHGEPALSNALAAAGEDLTYTGHHREGEVEVFEFSGALAPADTCAAQRVQAQLQRTAEAAVDGEVELRVDGEPLDAVLGLGPLGEPGETYRAPEPEEAGSDAPGAPSQTPAPGQTTAPGQPPAQTPVPGQPAQTPVPGQPPAQTPAPGTGQTGQGAGIGG
ncbi:hypothetical protein HDA30_001490 [Micrococcus cohnii]|uniref:GerMN domain-containing protein n=1 Tax=Micrococcus cohnii TaxID=993416 RepID=A0A7W7GPN0_9MICC|nr:hypothetical protein [Micrococcus cohnii]MBB4735982.1 hypothetical protein [Micrococcus cohnii]